MGGRVFSPVLIPVVPGYAVSSLAGLMQARPGALLLPTPPLAPMDQAGVLHDSRSDQPFHHIFPAVPSTFSMTTILPNCTLADHRPAQASSARVRCHVLEHARPCGLGLERWRHPRQRARNRQGAVERLGRRRAHLRRCRAGAGGQVKGHRGGHARGWPHRVPEGSPRSQAAYCMRVSGIYSRLVLITSLRCQSLLQEVLLSHQDAQTELMRCGTTRTVAPSVRERGSRMPGAMAEPGLSMRCLAGAKAVANELQLRWSLSEVPHAARVAFQFQVSAAVLLELTELAKPVEMPCLCCATRSTCAGHLLSSGAAHPLPRRPRPRRMQGRRIPSRTHKLHHACRAYSQLRSSTSPPAAAASTPPSGSTPVSSGPQTTPSACASRRRRRRRRPPRRGPPPPAAARASSAPCHPTWCWLPGRTRCRCVVAAAALCNEGI